MSEHPTQLETQSFDRDVLESSRPVLVDFHADWCQPCRAMHPAIDALARDYDGRATVAKVDVDAQPELSARFEIRSIPTVLIFDGGEIVDRFVGIASRDALARAIDAALARTAA